MSSRRKLFWTLVVAGILGVTLLAVGTYSILQVQLAAQAKERLRTEADLLGLTVASSGPSQSLHDQAVRAGRRLDLRVTLIAADGTVVGDSSLRRPALARLDNHLHRPEVQAAAAQGAGESVRRSGTTGVEYLYLARRVDGDPAVRFVRVAYPTSRLGQVPGALLLSLMLPVAGLLLVVASLAFRLHRQLALGVDRLAGAVSGDDAADLPGAGAPDLEELGRLAAAWDRTRRALAGRLEDLREEMHLASSVIAEIREGLLVVDAERRVLVANDALLRIFGLADDPTGRLLAEVIRNPDVSRAVDDALTGERESQVVVHPIPESGRTFEVRVAPRGAGRAGALILFLDITRQEALEGIRRDFVANVSHELRTPLTSITAFVETLLEGGLDDRKNSLQFLRIVRKHAGRMEELIDDLTDLSQIETGAVALEISDFDARELAREVAGQVAERYPDVAVGVKVEMNEAVRLRADRGRIEQVLWNLVDNAVKFSRPGGMVRILARRRDGRVQLVVQDDGVGIPEESLGKVFHRFYRVDKARSKEVGGTGLGLAIVKHLMRLHDGTVGVESELGKGSRFIVEFPLPPASDQRAGVES